MTISIKYVPLLYICDIFEYYASLYIIACKRLESKKYYVINRYTFAIMTEEILCKRKCVVTSAIPL